VPFRNLLRGDAVLAPLMEQNHLQWHTRAGKSSAARTIIAAIALDPTL
jgi:hypothetical protein